MSQNARDSNTILGLMGFLRHYFSVINSKLYHNKQKHLTKEREVPSRKGGRDESDLAHFSASGAVRYQCSSTEKEYVSMKTIHIYRLDHLSPALFEHLR